MLDKLPLVRGLPYINHWCGEQYYKGLVELTDSTQLAALIDISENTTSIEDMDAQIGSLLGGVDLHVGRARNSLLALEGPASVVEDSASRQLAHDMSVYVLTGSRSGHQSEAKVVVITLESGEQLHVHFDNASHASGNQRAYIKCPRSGKGHAACFRYTTVKQWRTQKKCVAYLGAWALHSMEQRRDWPKSSHKAYQPSEEHIQAVLPLVGAIRGQKE